MSKNYYPSAFDLHEVCKYYLKRYELNNIIQGEGIFMMNSTPEDIALKLSHLLFDKDKLDIIQGQAYKASENYTMSGFSINSKGEYSLNEAYETLRTDDSITLSDGYKLSILTKETIGDKACFVGSLDYRKKKPGRIEFMDTEQGLSEFKMFDLGNGKWQIEVNGTKPNDGREVKRLFETIIKKEKDVSMSFLEVDKMKPSQTISFFDKLMLIGLGSDWSYQDVKQLTFRRGQDNGNENDNDDEEATDTDLMGIKQAILEGKNLRDADFVKKFEKQGCMFTAMTFEFLHIREPKKIHMHAEFKGNPKIFEVSIANYYEATGIDAKYEMVGLPKDDCLKLQSVFWNNAKDTYYKVLIED